MECFGNFILTKVYLSFNYLWINSWASGIDIFRLSLCLKHREILFHYGVLTSWIYLICNESVFFICPMIPLGFSTKLEPSSTVFFPPKHPFALSFGRSRPRKSKEVCNISQNPLKITSRHLDILYLARSAPWFGHLICLATFIIYTAHCGL